MDISSLASLPNALAGAASDSRAAQVQSRIALAVLKQTQAAERQQAAALVRMLQQSEAAARGGVDVYA